MYKIAEECAPITGRGVGYKLFSAGLIPSMARNEMQRVYDKLRIAREEGIIPWEWIVDETRDLEKSAAWDGPRHFLNEARTYYRREFWNQQPIDVEIWSEKGTVRGVLSPSSTSTASASASCTGSAAPPHSTTRRSVARISRSSFCMLATSIRAE